MTTPKHSVNQAGKTEKRLPKYDATRIQLSSQRPSEVWRGMEQVRQWLKDDPENIDVYGILLDAVNDNRDLRDKVRELLTQLMEKGSKAAEEALASLPTGIQDLLADADDLYYAAEYERAIKLYRQVLRLDPENKRARDHLAKAEIRRITGEAAGELPRAAEQYYRRARSFIAARDIVTAMNLLSAAIEAAQSRNMKYPDAEQALSSMHDLITAEEFRNKAHQAMNESLWKDALDNYAKAQALDRSNAVLKKETEGLQSLLEADAQLKKGWQANLFTSLGKFQDTLNSAELILPFENTLMKSIRARIKRINRIRGVGLGVLIVGTIGFLYLNNFFGGSIVTPPTPSTQTSTLPISIEAFATLTITGTENIEPSPTATFTQTSTPAPSETATLPPTQSILGTGFIIRASVSSWDAPNGKFIERLGLYQPVTILERQEDAVAVWYRCSWINKDGQTINGWILGEYIAFGTPPTPRP